MFDPRYVDLEEWHDLITSKHFDKVIKLLEDLRRVCFIKLEHINTNTPDGLLENKQLQDQAAVYKRLLLIFASKVEEFKRINNKRKGA